MKCLSLVISLGLGLWLPSSLARADSQYFEASDGTRLHFKTWQSTRKPSVDLIVVNGIEDHADRYDTFAKKAASKGVRVIAFDLRGHGRSGGAQKHIEKFSTYAQDLDELLTHLQKQGMARKPFLYGYSMGGAIVSQYAARPKEQRAAEPRGLILSSPAIEPGSDYFFPIIPTLNLLSHIPGIRQLRPMGVDNRHFTHDPGERALKDRDPLCGRNPTLQYGGELIRGMRQIKPLARKIETPTLVVHGTSDTVTSPEGSKAFLDSISAQDKEYVAYIGAFHDLLHEAEPTRSQVQTQILKWVLKRD